MSHTVWAALSIAALLVGAGLIAGMGALAYHGRRKALAKQLRQTQGLEEEIAALRSAQAELERAKEAAESANAAKTRYLVAISHEIRSPLNAIYGYAQLLEREDAIPPLEAGGVIRRSAEHLTNLVEGLLDISRIESGVLKVRQDVVRLPALLDHVVDMFRMQAAAKGLWLEYKTEGRLPAFVRADEKRLRQILINMLSNAINYTHKGGVTLSVRYRSQMAFVDVIDTGIGIAPEDIERIFEPFERGSSSDAAMQPGLGLGLAITRVLARILGGEVTVSSEVGRGSIFQLQMLLPEPMAAPTGAAVDQRLIGYKGKQKTILVIDDNPSQFVVVRHLLRPLNFTVFAATNGTEGLALAERCTPDLVLLDIQMPDCTGWEVAAKLRTAFGRGLRIVMVSANAHEFRAGGDGQSNHDAFLTKPVDLNALLDVIGRQLDLDWIVADDDIPQVNEGSAMLPAEAGPYLERMRQYVKVGHVRAIETLLTELETDVPDSAGAVTEMRRLLDDYDLRGLARRLDHGD